MEITFNTEGYVSWRMHCGYTAMCYGIGIGPSVDKYRLIWKSAHCYGDVVVFVYKKIRSDA